MAAPPADGSGATAGSLAALVSSLGPTMGLGGGGLGGQLLLIAVATLVSEDLTCLATGAAAAMGVVPFAAGVLACFTGIVIGDLLLFAAGRLLGRAVLGRPPLAWWVSPAAVDRASAWLDRRGLAVVLATRFLPGTRLPTYLAAGALRTDARRFLLAFVAASALWTPLLVGFGALAGAQAAARFDDRRGAIVAVVAGVGALWALLRLAGRLADPVARERLTAWWGRTWRWEFWPPWLFYPPVVAWILLLGARYRSWTLFTAANPAMPAGGFVGESKAAILSRLPEDAVARFRLLPGDLPAEERLDLVATFLADHDLRWPVVLKPDVGQRGAGVVVVRSPDDAAAYLRRTDLDCLVQEYVDGPEVGIFWARRPGEARGRLLSLTDKRLPAVVGDGEATVAALVRADPRARLIAGTYLRRLGDESARVPAAGERVPLVEVGTHCRGAIFLDGEELRTPALEAAVETMSAAFEGFFFGRYDVRAPSFEALRAGRGIKVLELNGVTSEVTHIYDPANSLLAAYRALFAQWALAFEIGDHNRRLGTRPAGVTALARSVLAYRREVAPRHPV